MRFSPSRHRGGRKTLLRALRAAREIGLVTIGFSEGADKLSTGCSVRLWQASESPAG